VDLSGPFWGKCLEKRSDIATASDWGWEGGGWFQVHAKMDSATNSGESLLGAHFMQMHETVQGRL